MNACTTFPVELNYMNEDFLKIWKQAMHTHACIAKSNEVMDYLFLQSFDITPVPKFNFIILLQIILSRKVHSISVFTNRWNIKHVTKNKNWW